jgi:hypothetical protein
VALYFVSWYSGFEGRRGAYGGRQGAIDNDSQAAQAIADGKLKVVLSAFERTPVPVSIIYANQNMFPLKTRSFIDFAAPRLRERLSQIANRANA